MLKSDPIKLDGGTLHGVRSESDEPPLLLLHGVTRRWQCFTTVLPSLAMRWQINAMDFRGHGRSSRWPQQYEIRHYMEDTVSAIRARFQRPVVVWGHSLGAMVAAAAAAEIGDRVAALVLEDPPMQSMGPEIEDTPWHSFFVGLAEFAGHDRPHDTVVRELADLCFGHPRSNEKIRLGDVRDEASLRFMAACLDQVDPDVFEPIVAGQWLMGLDFEQMLQRLDCPTLLVQADPTAGGMLTDKEATEIDVWHGRLTHVKLIGAGHLLHWNDATRLLNHVVAFLESLPRDP